MGHVLVGVKNVCNQVAVGTVAGTRGARACMCAARVDARGLPEPFAEVRTSKIFEVKNEPGADVFFSKKKKTVPRAPMALYLP